MLFQLLQPFEFLVAGPTFYNQNAALYNTVYCKNEVIQVSYATTKKIVAIDTANRIVWWTADQAPLDPNRSDPLVDDPSPLDLI